MGMGEDARQESWPEALGDADLLHGVLDLQPMGIAILSFPDLTYRYVNQAFQSFAPVKEIVGHTNAEVFPETEFMAPEILATLERTGRPWRQDDTLVRMRLTPSGPLEDRYGTFQISPLGTGNRLYIVISAMDTTERVVAKAERERLREDETRRLHLAETMASVTRIIHSSLDYDEIMQRSLEEATKALGARAGAVFVALNPRESQARYLFGFPRWMLDRRFPAKMFPLAEMLGKSGEPVPIEADNISSLMNRELARLFGVRSMLAVPIVIRGRLAGGIGLVYQRPHRFSAAEIDFSRTFGVSVSLALENAERYGQQERVADALQEALLTLPERVEGLDFAHAYRSATEAARVGGDFYDLFQLERNTVGMTLGDMSGKGLSAAALTSLVKNAVRTQATQIGNSPADAMRIANTVLLRASGSETFATVFFAVLERASGRLVYCNAGHPTGAVARTDGEIERLTSNSSLIGAFGHPSFEDSEIMLDQGDVLFMYTDGVIETRSGSELFGEERLFDVLGNVRKPSARSLVKKVVEAVDAFAGGRLEDDIAILAVARV